MTFFCSSLSLLFISLGCQPRGLCHPTFFYLSDLVSPQLFVNSATKIFLFVRVSPPWKVSPPGGCHPLEGVTRGGRPQPLPPVTPLSGEQIRLRVPPKLFRVNSWILQMIVVLIVWLFWGTVYTFCCFLADWLLIISGLANSEHLSSARLIITVTLSFPTS